MEYWSYFNVIKILFALGMLYIVLAGEEDCLSAESTNGPIMCYKCLSYASEEADDNYCGDPFNQTANPNNAEIMSVVCNGYCVKWVRNVGPGVVRYERTCSTDLSIKMNINLVCIEESRPLSGDICFCDTQLCNHAFVCRPNIYVTAVLQAVLSMLYIVLYRMWN